MSEKVIHSNISKGINFNYKISYQIIVENGLFYYPAYKHSEKKTSIECYKCKKSELKSCVRYDKYNLCMLCVEETTKDIHHLNELTPDRYSPFLHIN
jgi:hypothetical protein